MLNSSYTSFQDPHKEGLRLLRPWDMNSGERLTARDLRKHQNASYSVLHKKNGLDHLHMFPVVKLRDKLNHNQKPL